MFTNVFNSVFGVLSAASLFVSTGLTPAPTASATMTVSPVPQGYLDPLNNSNQTIDSVLTATEDAVQQLQAKQPVRSDKPSVRALPAAASGNRGRDTSVHTAPVHSYKQVPPVASHASSSTSQTGNDLYWLARVIQAEAGAEPYADKLAVGNVIINRVNSSEYPNTIHDVIFERAYGHYAFTSVANGWIYHTPDSDSITAAEQVLNRQADVVPGALVFYNSAQTSADNWVRSRPVIREIGHLTFAR